VITSSTELFRQAADVIGERAPPKVRLDPEQDDRVAAATGKRSVQKRVLGPLDLAREAVDERHERSRGLEVVEALRIDARELHRRPRPREIGAGERSALPTVVPAAECGDQHRALELRPLGDAELVSHQGILRGRHRR
jgi:hypothetical protein